MYWLYEKNQLSNGTHVYENPVYQPLAGNRNGLFFRAYKQISNARDELWHASGRELLSVLDCVPVTRALVIDTAPRREGGCLHEVHAVAGITAATWTPIMIWLEHLFQDRVPPRGKSLASWKARFTDDECSRDHIREFAYLQGGYESGDWRWGGGSRTGPVMLWPSFWDAFLEEDRRLEAHWSEG
jgi:hypothetical protein